MITYAEKILNDIRNCDYDHVSGYELGMAKKEIMSFLGCVDTELDKLFDMMLDSEVSTIVTEPKDTKPLDLVLVVYRCLCATSTFMINGIHAEADEFGCMEDCDRGNAEDYGCGDMRFIPKLPTSEILSKYSITTNDYNTICNSLVDKLSFGSCSWCV